MQTTLPKLHDWEILKNIAPYLNTSDLLKTSTLSKQYNYTLRQYIRKYLLPKQNITAPTNQLNMVKKLFHRQIRIFNQVNNKQPPQILNPNLILKDIQVGKVFTLIQTIQGKQYFVRNSQLSNKQFEIKTFVQLDKKYQGKFVTLIGDFLYYVNDNKLNRCTLKEEGQTLLQEQTQIAFESQITSIKVSLTHIYVITTTMFHQNRLFAVQINQFKSTQVLYQQEQQKTKHINVQNISVGANTAYYIVNFKVFELDLQSSKPPKIMKSLKDKKIRRIINGAKHFFAIEKGNKLTEQWDTKDLVQWAYKQGYEDYIKIFKSQKVTGKTLLNMDKRYMQDVLGILNVKIQQRLMVQLQQANVEKQQNCTILGWGRNQKGQLGLNPSNPVSNPHKIVLPQACSFLKCSNNTTLIHNKKTGKILMNSVVQGKLEWQVIFQNVTNIWSLSVYKDTIMILCPIAKERISQQLSEAPVHHKKQKLRTAKNIIDKVEWDENIDKKQFRVGYLDKFTGILQISFEQLLQSTQIKDYRIQYFKRNGQTVWSKKDRIDIV